MAYQPKSYRKFVATAATATLVASAVAPFASAASFNDVNSRYAEAVDFVTSKGVQGLTDSKFGTADNIKRVDAAVMLVKVLGLDVDAAPASGFTDVPSRAVKEVNALKAAGITSGKSETKFNSDAQITRGELAIWIKRAFDLKGEAHNTFSDVSGIYTNAVTALVVNKVTLGKTETKFGTQDNATRGEYALFLKRAYDASNVEDTDAVVKGIKAINATTVEITYGEKVTVEDVKAAKYTIDGLEVKNAAIKQTDDKTVVLTTATQEGNKEYTVKNGEETLGKFKGVSAVIPTAIKVTTPSVQGTLGKEVTVSAQVTVPEGQSKEGIPVTFNIVSDTNSNLNGKVEVVTYTNKDGVASYSYTRYYKHNDSVAAYATDKSSVVASGKVYWAEALAITEVTQGNTLSNNAKKVYKVTGTPGETVNVTFQENVNVTPDKLVRGVTITDAPVYSIGADGKTVTQVTTPANKYPYQTSTGGVQFAQVKLNASGEATFTLTGASAKVTPIVFADKTAFNNATNQLTSGNGKLDVTELQATAPTVEFSLQHTIGLAVEAVGTEKASYSVAPAGAKHVGNNGGRSYKVAVTDNKGNKAPALTPVNVTFKTGNVSGNVAIYDADGKLVTATNGVYSLLTNKDGEAVFTVVNTVKDSYALPTVFVDNGTTPANGKLDASDLQKDATISYFGDAVVKTASIKFEDKDGKEVKELLYNETTKVTYQPVDQNGFPYFTNVVASKVSFEFTTTFGDINGVRANGVALGTTNNTLELVPGTDGKITFDVTTTRPTSLTIDATASNSILAPVSATFNFVGATAVLDRVNQATTADAVLTALLADSDYAKKLAGLTAAEQKTVATAVLNNRPVGGYSAENLTTKVTTEVNSINGAKVTAGVVYTASTAGSSATSAKGVYANATTPANTLTIESAAGATAYNGVKVVFEKNTVVGTTVTTAYDSGSKTLTVKLPVSAVDAVGGNATLDTTNATFENIETAIEAFNNSALTVTLATLTGDASELVGKTIELKGAAAQVPATEAELVFTFSEAVTAGTLGSLTLAVDGTAATVSATTAPTLSADGKVLKVKLASNLPAGAKEVTALTQINVVSGKTLVLPISIK